MRKKAVIVFAGIAVFYTLSFLFLHRGKSPQAAWTQIISSDGAGFYSYLPKIFIEGDLNYTAKDHLHCSPTQNGKFVNRFYCGTAILESPFFFMACAGAKLTGYPVDGYSLPFALAIGFAAIFYALAGFILLYKILVRYWNCNQTYALVAVSAIAIGTNLIYYSTYQGSFSHVFSFFTITAFVFSLHKTIEHATLKSVFMSSLLFSLLVFIRPVNLIFILFVPAVFGSAQNFIAFIKSLLTFKFISISLIGLLVPFTLQSIIWHAQTGNFIEWSYKQEGFYFLKPQLLDMLVGFRRGLFIYCPLLLLSIPGLWFLIKENKWKGLWILSFLLCFCWVTASWWHYTYGDTFGIRPFNDILLVFCILLVYTLTFISWKKVLYTVMILFSGLNLVYAYQFSIGTLNISTMDKEKFFHLFLKTSASYADYYKGSNDIPPYAPNGFITLADFTQVYDTLNNGCFFVNGIEWLGGTQCVYPDTLGYTRHSWIELSYKRKLESPTAMKNVVFVFHTTNPKDKSTKIYYTLHVKEKPAEKINVWETCTHRIWVPNLLNGSDVINLYLWNPNKEVFYIDDYHIKLQVPRW